MKNNNYIRQWISNHPIWTIVILSVIVRLVTISLYQHITIYPDSSGYMDLAERLSHLQLRGYEGQRTPGYPLLIILASSSPLLTIGLQSVLGIITLVLSYKTLLLLHIKRYYALIATLTIALYLPIVFFELTILSETLTLFFVTLIFYLFFQITIHKRDYFKDFFCLSLACGYLVFIKPFYIFLAIILFTFLIYKNPHIKNILKKYILVLTIPALVYLGWSYVNKINTGYFVPTTFYGFNAAQNCVSFAEKTSDEYKNIATIYAKYRDSNIAIDRGTAMSIWEAYDELETETKLSFADLSNRLYNYSKATIRMNIGGYLKQVFISWKDFWKTSLYWQQDRAATPHTGEALLYICYVERIVVQLIKVLFMLLIPYNLIMSLKRKELNPQLIISIVVLTASILQAFASYGTNSRFSFPFELLIFTSVLINIANSRFIKEKS